MECTFEHFAKTAEKKRFIIVVKRKDERFFDLMTEAKKPQDVHPDIVLGCLLKVTYKGPTEWKILEVMHQEEEA